MRVLLDVNVLLDVLLKRMPWLPESEAVWQASDQVLVEGYIAATVVTNIFYITRRALGQADARDAVRACLDSFAVCTVDRAALEAALAMPGGDFEDNVLVACAQSMGLDGIVTRDQSGFTQAGVQVYTPADLTALLQP